MNRTRVVVVAALLAGAWVSASVAGSPVPASRETAPMLGLGDRADDPAVWVNAADPGRSLILATSKDEGVYVYGLDGSERQRLPVGFSNNIDVRGDLAVASNNGVGALSWFRIDPKTQRVTHAGDTKLDRAEPYGVCLGVVGGQLQVAVTFKDGSIQIWGVTDTGAGPLTITPVRTIKLTSQAEGCVFDDEAKRLVVGEERVGVWVVELSSNTAPMLIDRVGGGSGLVADVEGVSIWRGSDGEGFIVVSAQSQDRFVVYDRQAPHAARGSFSVGPSADGTVDGVSHTDGLDVVSDGLPGFPRGILVLQDDANPRRMLDQNFKIVDWREVERTLVAGAVVKP